MFEKISLQNVIFYRFWMSLTYSNSNSKKILSQLCTQLAYSWNVEKEAVCGVCACAPSFSKKEFKILDLHRLSYPKIIQYLCSYQWYIHYGACTFQYILALSSKTPYFAKKFGLLSYYTYFIIRVHTVVHVLLIPSVTWISMASHYVPWYLY